MFARNYYPELHLRRNETSNFGRTALAGVERIVSITTRSPEGLGA